MRNRFLFLFSRQLFQFTRDRLRGRVNCNSITRLFGITTCSCLWHALALIIIDPEMTSIIARSAMRVIVIDCRRNPRNRYQIKIPRQIKKRVEIFLIGCLIRAEVL